ncbi:MAG: NAD-dependent epimerase/dehydratase family protein [Bacteroidales bacterium]|nr:NAD-dependent epimerase/dehydratase family protein [Bacteroidales bacterium]
MQTILGAGGAIGKDLAKSLQTYTELIRLVGRNPQKVNEADQLFKADLTQKEDVFKAVQGSEIVYITVGFPYKTSVWKSVWPSFMRNVIDACKEHKCKLVFFDNVYMYDPSHIPHMTEDTPINPTSKKGAVRAEIAEMLMDEVAGGNIEALIARSADFYGPGINNSVLQEAVLKPLKAGKSANWFCSLDKVHSYTYTPDAAKATAILGNDKKAYGQVWHVPTAASPPTGREWIEAFAKELNVKPKSMVAGKFVIRLMGLFNPIMKEFVEMLYQYDRDYVFDSSKFEKAYDFKTTSYSEGISEVAKFSK